MRKIVEYDVVVGGWEGNKGVEKVNDLIDDGWQPLIGGFGQDEEGWTQVMVRYDEDGDDQ